MIDGCPSCVTNSEWPRSIVAVDGGSRCAYICSDCGHVWATDWAEKPCGVGEIHAETWENRASPQGALTPAGSDHLTILETRGADGIMPSTQTTPATPVQSATSPEVSG